jgi:hypothetical protein
MPVVAVGNHPMAVDNSGSTDRKKVLQITTFMAVRVMRVVCCGVF